MKDELRTYYALRAHEYDALYRKPERQEDLDVLHGHVRRLLHHRDVLEVACGTGYWTRVIAPTARSILATDINPEMLSIAREKNLSNSHVRFHHCDAWGLTGCPGAYNGGLAAFWLSHVHRAGIQEWLSHFCGVLTAGASVVLIDNRFVEGNSTPISTTDSEGNTYQERRLTGGSTHRIMKNYFSAEELRTFIPTAYEEAALVELRYYWLFCMKRRSDGDV
jgi:ubiquinone/menaquinone biosynthesis C-methylase UbiE